MSPPDRPRQGGFRNGAPRREGYRGDNRGFHRDGPPRPAPPPLPPAEWLEGARLVAGLQPVREAIRAYGDRVDRLLVDDREVPRLEAFIRFATDQGVKRIDRISRTILDQLGGTAAHQGVAAWVPPLTLVPGKEVLERPNLLGLALDSIQDPQNFGAVVRSAVALAGAPVVWPEHSSAPLTPATFRASAGAIEHAVLCRVPSLVAWLDDAKTRDIQVVGLDAQGDKTLFEVDLTVPTILVVGGEHEGLSRSVRRHCTQLARVATMAHVDSLNASVAAALALYEVARQRMISSTSAQ